MIWRRLWLFFVMNLLLVLLFGLSVLHFWPFPLFGDLGQMAWERLVWYGLLFLALALVFSLLLAGATYYLLYHEEEAFRVWLNRLKSTGQNNAIGRFDPSIFYLSPAVNEELAALAQVLEDLRLKLREQKLRSPSLTEANQNKDQLIWEERHRLAREIHDSVSQDLFALTMLLGTMELLDPSDKQYQKIVQQVGLLAQQAQNELRALLLHLRPVGLAERDLATGIAHLFAELETKVSVAFETDLKAVPLSEKIEDHLFRIVQELLSNALRHAQAQTISCSLYEKNQTLYLLFRDDGQGFDLTEAKQSSGYGLKNIEERIHSLAGQVKMLSAPGQGTQVIITIPLPTTSDRKDSPHDYGTDN